MLGLALTDMFQYYDKASVKVCPTFGLSDHNVITVVPKERSASNSISRKGIKVIDTRSSRKQELDRYLNSVDWSIIVSQHPCAEKNQLFVNLINTGVNIIMPIRKKKVFTLDNY